MEPVSSLVLLCVGGPASSPFSPAFPPMHSGLGGLPQAGLLSRPPTARFHPCSQTPGHLFQPLFLGRGPYLQPMTWTSLLPPPRTHGLP